MGSGVSGLSFCFYCGVGTALVGFNTVVRLVAHEDGEGSMHYWPVKPAWLLWIFKKFKVSSMFLRLRRRAIHELLRMCPIGGTLLVTVLSPLILHIGFGCPCRALFLALRQDSASSLV